MYAETSRSSPDVSLVVVLRSSLKCLLLYENPVVKIHLFWRASGVYSK